MDAISGIQQIIDSQFLSDHLAIAVEPQIELILVMGAKRSRLCFESLAYVSKDGGPQTRQLRTELSSWCQSTAEERRTLKYGGRLGPGLATPSTGCSPSQRT